MNFRNKLIVWGASSATVVGGTSLYFVLGGSDNKSEISSIGDSKLNKGNSSLVLPTDSKTNPLIEEKSHESVLDYSGNEYIDDELEKFILIDCGESEECKSILNLLKKDGGCIVKTHDDDDYVEWYLSSDIVGLKDYLENNWSSYKSRCELKEYLYFDKKEGSWSQSAPQNRS